MSPAIARRGSAIHRMGGSTLDVQRYDRFREVLARSSVDAVIAASPANTWYLSECNIMTQKALPERLAMVVWPKQGEPVYVVCGLEAGQAREESWIKDIRDYVEFVQSPVDLAVAALSEMGLTAGKIGYEATFLTAHYYDQLKTGLPDATLVPVDGFFDRVRMIKTAQEQAVLEDAFRATDRAIRRAFEATSPGQTEKQVSDRLQVELLREGAEGTAFSVLCTGVNSLITHPVPAGRVIADGELMRTDFGGIFGGYYSDVARTVVVGTPSARQVATYEWIWAMHERLIAAMTPGRPVAELYNLCQRTYIDAGYPCDRPHIGHGVGLGLHEHPMIAPGTKEILQPGMCLCIEPNLTVPGVEKYHTEDLILVTEQGPRILSRSADWSKLLCVTGG